MSIDWPQHYLPRQWKFWSTRATPIAWCEVYRCSSEGPRVYNNLKHLRSQVHTRILLQIRALEVHKGGAGILQSKQTAICVNSTLWLLWSHLETYSYEVQDLSFQEPRDTPIGCSAVTGGASLAERRRAVQCSAIRKYGSCPLSAQRSRSCGITACRSSTQPSQQMMIRLDGCST